MKREASEPGVVGRVLAPSVGLGGGRARRRGATVWLVLLAIVTVGALVHVAVRLKGLEVAYELGRERRQGAELEEERRRLQIEIGVLKDPGRVVQLAREKLKMGPPPPGAIVKVETGPGARNVLRERIIDATARVAATSVTAAAAASASGTAATAGGRP